MRRYQPRQDRLPNRNSAASCWPRAHFGSAWAVRVVRGRSATEGLGGFAPPEGEAMLSWFYLTGQAISTPNSGAEQDLGTVKDCAGAADPGGNSEVWEPVVFPSQLSRGLGTSSSARSAHPSLNIRAPQGSQHPKCVPRSPQPPSGSGEVGSRQRQPGDLPFSRSFPPRAQVCQGRYGQGCSSRGVGTARPGPGDTPGPERDVLPATLD